MAQRVVLALDRVPTQILVDAHRLQDPAAKPGTGRFQRITLHTPKAATFLTR